MDIRKFAQDVFTDQFGKTEGCYLCGCSYADQRVLNWSCGVRDCPRKNAAPGGGSQPVDCEPRATLSSGNSDAQGRQISAVPVAAPELEPYIPRDELPGGDEFFPPQESVTNHSITEDERLDDPRHVPYSNLGRR